VRDEVGSLLQREFSSLRIHSKCLLRFSVRCHRITDEGWNYPKSRSGSLTGQRAKFVAILFLALAANFKIVVNICHLLSYYFLELLPIFVIFKHIGLISTFNSTINIIRHVA
jgi:hypothetical protein